MIKEKRVKEEIIITKNTFSPVPFTSYHMSEKVRKEKV